jgi:hypothetical protein
MLSRFGNAEFQELRKKINPPKRLKGLGGLQIND